MGFCNLCKPVLEVPDEDMLRHMKVEHDLDVAAEVEKWPDGEWVVYDKTLGPEDFDVLG